MPTQNELEGILGGSLSQNALLGPFVPIYVMLRVVCFLWDFCVCEHMYLCLYVFLVLLL